MAKPGLLTPGIGLLTPEIGIILTNTGVPILVDSDDLEALEVYAWRAVKTGHKVYAVTDVDDETTYMHRQLLGLPPGDPRLGDHKNGCSLDNRRSNLQVVTALQNAWSTRRSKLNSTGFPGVYLDRKSQKYKARIYSDGRRISLGSYDTPEEAGAAYAAWATLTQTEVMKAAA